VSVLQLKNITKIYDTGDNRVTALGGVSIDFRENEFVSILGPSGCGKTTLLNIVGGLDRYTDGDLLINGKSTKDFKDSDWDTYRNHSVGFVFQSYNLIPHQTVLANVELALTLSGVSKAERRRRATEALEKVGLGDQLKKKPNQMSGGQMQRVAIARAIVNDPDILLADEPTGALDTQTSVQIMEILKEIAKDKLVIMVTHNPELAEQYSTRIVRLRDGLVTDDSDPFTAPEATEEIVRKTTVKKGKRTSMSFGTAFSLSLNNLMTKKGRTFMTSFAGSIGIIGIALILALSNGINAYIALVQEDTLSTYPLTIQETTQDTSAMMEAMIKTDDSSTDHRDSNMVYVDDSLGTMMGAMSATVENDLESFKAHIDANYDDIKDSVSDIQYTYDFDLQVFNMAQDKDEDGNTVTEARKVGMEVIFDHMGDAFSGMSELMAMSGGMGMNVMSEMINNQDLLDQQYDVIAGDWPTEYNEVVLVVGSNNQISKMTLYMLGILDPDQIDGEMADLMAGKYESKEIEPITFEEIMDTKLMMLNTADFFEVNDKVTPYSVNGKKYPVWMDSRKTPGVDQDRFITEHVTEHGTELVISGIIRPKTGTAATSISGAIGYTKALTDHILDQNTKSEVIKQQKETPDYNVLTGLKFERTQYTPETIHELVDKVDDTTMERFYAFMTQQVLSNPDYSDRLKVENAETFLGFYMLMPAEQQASIMSAVLDAAKASGQDMTGLFQTLNTMNPTVQITPDNLIQLLPVLSTETQYVALQGYAMTAEQVAASMGITVDQLMMTGWTEEMGVIPGLIQIAGDEKMSGIYAGMTEQIKTMTVNDEIFVAILGTMNADDEAFITLEETLYNMAPQTDATYDGTLRKLGDAEKAAPASINFYAKDFASKDVIEQFIADYNVANKDDTTKEIKYTDVIGIMMSSVTMIIDVISYVLIAFVSISLVVSSIMIGIITYISVLERTKEIGILRAMGASKKDISRVFNAETFIIGLAAGLIGILVTILICVPVSAIIQTLSGISNIAAILPWQGAIILVLISMLLTVVAGLIPAFSAAKKDPVIALRSE
jgi:putative ABC transport system permease protein